MTTSELISEIDKIIGVLTEIESHVDSYGAAPPASICRKGAPAYRHALELLDSIADDSESPCALRLALGNAADQLQRASELGFRSPFHQSRIQSKCGDAADSLRAAIREVRHAPGAAV